MNEVYAPITIRLFEAKSREEWCKSCGYVYLVEVYHNNEHIKTICLRCQNLHYWVVKKKT